MSAAAVMPTETPWPIHARSHSQTPRRAGRAVNQQSEQPAKREANAWRQPDPSGRSREADHERPIPRGRPREAAHTTTKDRHCTHMRGAAGAGTKATAKATEADRRSPGQSQAPSARSGRCQQVQRRQMRRHSDRPGWGKHSQQPQLCAKKCCQHHPYRSNPNSNVKADHSAGDSAPSAPVRRTQRRTARPASVAPAAADKHAANRADSIEDKIVDDESH